MGTDWTGSRSEDPGDDSPSDRPYGPRPYGPRPYGPRPYGPRPYGPRPYGPRSDRPAPMPYGPRSDQPRPVTPPYGPRPYGPRPYGPRGDEGPLYLDPDEWATDIATLFCESSAVLRLGANLTFGLTELPYPHPPVLGVPRYLPEPKSGDGIEDVADGAVAAAVSKAVADVSKDSATQLSYRRLRPRAHELTIQIAVRNRLVRTIVQHPEVAWTLKQDIASALAFRADQGFLHGDGAQHGPRGIACIERTLDEAPGANALETARGMVSTLRSRSRHFSNPGWILHPMTLDELGIVLKDHEAKNDAGQLLTYDGADGGTLLGYPYIVSAATQEGIPAKSGSMVFGSDWTEAWVAVEDPLMTVDVAPDIRLESDETVIRAVTLHDFALRAPGAFVHTGAKPAEAAKKPGGVASADDLDKTAQGEDDD
jgi:HK97 family phage major capsid protein